VVDIFSKKTRSVIMSRIKGRDTGPERIVRRIVRKLGYSYRSYDRSLPGKPDLVFKHLRCVLFVHGCFWHGHSGCRRARTPTTNVAFWTNKIRMNKLRDAKTYRSLKRAGWKVCTVWQCELKELEHLEQRLGKFFKAREQEHL